jgi:hypothetical protein
MIAKYFVVAMHWDSKTKKQVRCIVGEFGNFINAEIFKESYNSYYHSNSEVVNSLDLLNLSEGGDIDV